VRSTAADAAGDDLKRDDVQVRRAPGGGRRRGDVLELLQQHGWQPRRLVALLQAIQARYAIFLKPCCGREPTTGCSLVESVRSRDLLPLLQFSSREGALVCACLGHGLPRPRRGAIVERFEDQFGIAAGRNHADGQFTLEPELFGAVRPRPGGRDRWPYFLQGEESGVRKTARRPRQSGFDRGEGNGRIGLSIR